MWSSSNSSSIEKKLEINQVEIREIRRSEREKEFYLEFMIKDSSIENPFRCKSVLFPSISSIPVFNASNSKERIEQNYFFRVIPELNFNQKCEDFMMVYSNRTQNFNLPKKEEFTIYLINEYLEKAIFQPPPHSNFMANGDEGKKEFKDSDFINFEAVRNYNLILYPPNPQMDDTIRFELTYTVNSLSIKYYGERKRADLYPYRNINFTDPFKTELKSLRDMRNLTDYFVTLKLEERIGKLSENQLKRAFIPSALYLTSYEYNRKTYYLVIRNQFYQNQLLVQLKKYSGYKDHQKEN